MANLRISQLPSATTAASTDLLPFVSVSGSETRRITTANLGIVLTQLGLSVGSTAPSTPYNGQMWVDTSTNPPVVKVWNGVSFTVVSFRPSSSIITNPSGTAPTVPALGQLWQDTSASPDELKMYDGSNWVRVDPNGITQTAGDARYLQIATAATTYLALSGGTLTGDLTLTGAPTTNNMAATKKYVDDEIAAIPPASGVPTGTIIYTAATSEPTGYLKCNGAPVSRTDYADLFSAIGTIYGSGDGSTTFNVPELRGEFIRGWDDSRGVDSGRQMGSSGWQDDAFESHSHDVTDPGHSHTSNRDLENPNSNGISQGPGNRAHGVVSSGTTITQDNTTGISIDSQGGTETRPRNLAMLACIKT